MLLLYYQTIIAATIGISLGLYTRGPAVELWISSDEVARIYGGAAEPIYIIRDGAANPATSNSLILGNHDDQPLDHAQKKLVLPRNVNSLKFSWRAPKTFHYTFMELRSSDPSIMGPPLLSITLDDSMPNKDTQFRMDFPCTGEQSGVASVSIVLRIQDLKNGLDIPASPVHLNFDKQCVEAPTCEPRCANGGVCNALGRCTCPAGFYGNTCRIIFCVPHCYNAGRCVAPGVCQCQKGFFGDRCQEAVCENDCSGHGYCFKPGSCYCYQGWTGASCEKHVDSVPDEIRTATERSKKMRLVKNRRYWSDSS